MRYLIFSLLLITTPLEARKFLSDDPLLVEPKPRDVGAPKSRKLSDYYDFYLHQFRKPGERQPEHKHHSPIRAKAVNTLGEPMDGDWYVKRHYWNRMSAAELKRGPGDQNPPDTSAKWTITAAKSEGITPGFVMLDGKKRRFFVKFDPLSNPEMATSADMIVSKLFHAIGYWVPENYLIYFKDDQLELGEDVQLADKTGKTRKMTRRDLLEILLKVPRDKEGRYRGTASLGVAPKTIGPPRYFGTRRDDPNDVVPHEHRRDMRSLHVFCAWVDHDDSRAINNIDGVIEEDGIKRVRHFLLDFGSTLGSASWGPNSARSGEYLFSWSESAKNLFSLGLHVPAWATAKFPNYPAVGRFEWQRFRAETWVPEYPNPAFVNRLPDDEFFAAKQVMAFTDADIRALVETGEISDPNAVDYLVECLSKRRDKIGAAFYAKVLPLDRFAVRGGSLAWEDLSKSAGAVNIQWHRFNNDTETRTPISGAKSAQIPASTGSEFICAELTQASKPSHKIFVYLRAKSGTLEIAGIDREW